MKTYVCFFIGLLMILQGCDGIVCTQIGCDDQLEISFIDPDGFPVVDFSGSIQIGGETISFVCGSEWTEEANNPNHCLDQGRLVFSEAVGTFQITVTSADGTLAGDLSLEPTYVTVSPNGFDCGPNCLRGDVEITLQPTTEVFAHGLALQDKVGQTLAVGDLYAFDDQDQMPFLGNAALDSEQRVLGSSGFRYFQPQQIRRLLGLQLEGKALLKAELSINGCHADGSSGGRGVGTFSGWVWASANLHGSRNHPCELIGHCFRGKGSGSLWGC